MAAKEKIAKEKPLEKMTAKELRELAKEIPQISGAQVMNTAEHKNEKKAARGIVEEKKARSDASVRDIKKKIKALKADHQAAIEAKDNKQSTIYRRRISRLKKKSRKAA